MTFEPDESLSLRWPEVVMKIRARTPARLLVGRAGAAYRTTTQLELRSAHANARDAVRAELKLATQLGADFVRQWGLFEVCTRAESKDEFLQRPSLGRSFSEAIKANAATQGDTGGATKASQPLPASKGCAFDGP